MNLTSQSIQRTRFALTGGSRSEWPEFTPQAFFVAISEKNRLELGPLFLLCFHELQIPKTQCRTWSGTVGHTFELQDHLQ